MKLVTNNSEFDVIDYNVEGTMYTVKAGQSIRMPDSAVDYLCKIYGFLEDEGKCLDEADAPSKDKEEASIKADEAASEVEGPKDSEECEPVSSLSTIHGLGGKSIEKLLKAGVRTKGEFGKLKHEELKVIVGPLVASKFKTH